MGRLFAALAEYPDSLGSQVEIKQRCSIVELHEPRRIGMDAYRLVTPPEVAGPLIPRVEQHSHICTPASVIAVIASQWRCELEDPLSYLQVVTYQVVRTAHPRPLRNGEHIPVKGAAMDHGRIEAAAEPLEIDRNEPAVVVVDRPGRSSTQMELADISVWRRRVEAKDRPGISQISGDQLDDEIFGFTDLHPPPRAPSLAGRTSPRYLKPI